MTQEKLDKQIGNKESVKLQAGSYMVKAVSIEAVKKKTGELVGDKLILSIQHPDAQDLVALSSVAYLKNRQLTQSAMWYQEDVDGNIPKNSALAETMRFYKVTSPRQFESKVINVEVDAKGYLCVKAY